MGFHIQKFCHAIAAEVRRSTFFCMVDIIFCQNLREIIGFHRNIVLWIFWRAFMCVLTFLYKKITFWFLALMSNSRSDKVTQCLCMYIVYPLKYFCVLYLCLKGVSWVAQWSIKDFHRCCKDVKRMFQGSFKGISGVFLECFKRVSRVFEPHFLRKCYK